MQWLAMQPVCASNAASMKTLHPKTMTDYHQNVCAHV